MSGIGLMLLGPVVPVGGGTIAGAFDLTYVYHNPDNVLSYPDSLAASVAPTQPLSTTSLSFTPEVRPYGGFFIDPTGTYLYVTGQNNVSGTTGTKQYIMSTTWATNTANTSTETTITPYGTRGIWFRSDGTLMVLTTSTEITSYELTTPWSISTYTNAVTHTGGQSPIGTFFFSPDGTKGYYVGRDSGTTTLSVTQYNYTTAWDISAYDSYTYFTTTVPVSIPSENIPSGQAFFNEDGTVLTCFGNDVHVFTVSTAYDLSSTVTLVKSIAAGPTIGVAASTGLTWFRTYGTYRYTPVYYGQSGTSTLSNSVRALSLGTSFKSQTDDTSGVFFKPDGTIMFLSDYVDDKVYSYALSTAWDTSTAVYQTGKDLLGGRNAVSSIFFKPDGTRFYCIDPSNFYEYEVQTAWDLDTAFVLNTIPITNFGFSSNTLRGLYFSQDGSRILFLTTTGDTARQLTLSTAWDLGSTLTLESETFSTVSQDATPNGIWANSDGTKIFVYGVSNHYVYQYNLGTAWDLSTAVYSKFFNASSWVDTPSSYSNLFIDQGGSRMYLLGDGCVFKFGMQDRGF